MALSPTVQRFRTQLEASRKLELERGNTRAKTLEALRKAKAENDTAGMRAALDTLQADAKLKDTQDAERAKAQQAAQQGAPSPTANLTQERIDTNAPEANVPQDVELTRGGPQGPRTQPAARGQGSEQLPGGGISPEGAPVPGRALVPEAPGQITSTQETTHQLQPNVFSGGVPVARGPATTTQRFTRDNVLTPFQREALLERRRRNDIDVDFGRQELAIKQAQASASITRDFAQARLARLKGAAELKKSRDEYMGFLVDSTIAVETGVTDEAETAAIREMVGGLPENVRGEFVLRASARRAELRRKQEFVDFGVVNADGTVRNERVPKALAGSGLAPFSDKVLEGVSGAGGGGAGLGTTTKGDLLESQIANADALSRLRGLRSEYEAVLKDFGVDPLTTFPQLGAEVIRRGERLGSEGIQNLGGMVAGLGSGKVPAEAAAAIRDFNAGTQRNLNLYIRDITGAQMSVQEAERIIASMPNLTDSPTAFLRLIDTIKQELTLSALRNDLFLKDGLGYQQIEQAIQLGLPSEGAKGSIQLPDGSSLDVRSTPQMDMQGRVSFRQVGEIMQARHREFLGAIERDPNLSNQTPQVRRSLAWHRLAADHGVPVDRLVSAVAPEDMELLGLVEVQ